jgi:hypothetical protein
MIRRLTMAGLMIVTSIIAFAVPSPPAQALDNTPWRLPVTPPRCSTAQAESGNVDGCLLAFYEEPAATGWGTPPAPGVGEGWRWNGYWYNGSPALASWESTYIASNTTKIGGLNAGNLQTHVAVRSLFEGFLSEITANGYRVADASGYAFRCTSANGGWSCPSGSPSGLSNHAWGLAVDMNAGTNPIRSYTGIDGATACATPIQTDLPQWVIQTAERWGLYWGGYGWNSGCADTTTQRTSLNRDPPHFEFRGTPRQAAAIATYNLARDPNAFCRTVVNDTGLDTQQCNRSGRPGDGWRMPITVAAPAGAVAAMINLTATDAEGPGFLTLEDCGPRSGARSTSALTFSARVPIATMAVVPIGPDGRFCVYRRTAVHSIVDVVAYLGPNGEKFTPSAPTRLIDTRQSTPVTAVGERVVPTNDGASRITNIVSVNAAAPGFLRVGGCGSLTSADFSNLNYTDRTVRSNMALMDGNDTGACVYSMAQTDIVVDEIGKLDPQLGYGWQLAPPRRALDTRECADQWCKARPTERSVIRLDLNTEAPAAAIAITVTEANADGFITVGRCADLEGTTAPTTSNVNYVRGTTVTNMALVALDGGDMCIFTLAAAHVIIDVQATLAQNTSIGVISTPATRLHDSRLR